MRKTSLGECVDIINGFAFKSEHFSTDRCGLPVVRIRDVVRGFSETYYNADFPTNVVVENGDLLIGMDGEFNVGRWNAGRALLNQRVCKVVARDQRLEQDYLKHLLPRILRRIEDATPFVTVKHLSSEDLKEQQIVLPSLVEQKRIAAILERADRLRRLRRYGLDMAGTILTAAFRRMFGEPITLMGKWERKSFGELLTTALRNGLSPSNTGTVTARVLTLSAITGGVFDSSASKIAPFMAVPPAEKRVYATHFLICRGNGNLGLVGRGKFPPHDNPDCVFPDTMIAAQINPRLICRQFVDEVWKSPAIRKQIEASARTTNGTHKINQEVLEEIEIPVPALAIQHKFAVLAERQERARQIHRESLRQAEHLFQTLLERAFTSGL